ncbi:ATP-grasp domain-containing protein [Roseibium sp. M-1]
MAHLLFGSISKTCLATLEAALGKKHSVTMITTPDLRKYYECDAAEALLKDVTCVEIDDYTNIPVLTETIASVHNDRPIDGAVAVFEPTVLPLVQACDRLGIKATALGATKIARDKSATRKILAENGIPTVPHAVVSSSEEALDFARNTGYPIVLKPNNGMASLAVKTALNEADIKTYFEEYRQKTEAISPSLRQELAVDGRIIAEKYITGTLYSVEMGLGVDGYKFYVLSRRNREEGNDILELGSTMPGTLDKPITEKAQTYVQNILTICGFDRGIFHVEIIIGEDGEPTLIEINPRLMGGTSPSLYNLAADANIFSLLIDIHLDLPTGPAPEIKGAAASRVIGSRETCRVRSDLPDNWISSFADEMAYHNIPIRANQLLPKMEHNFHSLGQFQVKASSPAEADRKADDLLERIGATLGIDLCR